MKIKTFFLVPEFIKELKFKLNSSKKFCPVFLIGCGRSGTTILGKTLGKHRHIAYLNERRDLWHKAYPQLDIWKGEIEKSKLYLDERNTVARKSERLRHFFYREQVFLNGTILLEKLPINNFRLNFIHSVFPEARYIYLCRNGVEVARSISKRIDKAWYGNDDMKLDFLYKFAADNFNFNISALNDLTYMHKGMLEWRISMELSEQFFSKLNSSKYHRLSYESLVKDPFEEIKSIFNFLGMDIKDKTIEKFTAPINRKSTKINEVTDHKLQDIGGDYLKLSLKNKLVDKCSPKK